MVHRDKFTELEKEFLRMRDFINALKLTVHDGMQIQTTRAMILGFQTRSLDGKLYDGEQHGDDTRSQG